MTRKQEVKYRTGRISSSHNCGICSFTVFQQHVQKEQQLVDNWNAQNEPGGQVIYTTDTGEKIATTTRSKAELLSGHTAVIWLEGVRGCYLLSRVQAV